MASARRIAWSVAAGMVCCSPLPAQVPLAHDADVSTFDQAAYLRAREAHIDLLRGVPHFLPYDARTLAVHEMESAQLRTPSIDTAFWTPIGPAPLPNGQVVTGTPLPVSGRVVAIAVHPTNPDIVYVGAAQGGVYRSLDGGANWTPIFDSAQTLAIGALALAPSNPEILYVGTGEPNGSSDSFFGVGLYRVDSASTTANLTGPINPAVTTGLAGTTAFTGRSISKVLVHPTDPAIVFVATTTGTGGNPSGGSIGLTVPPLGMLGVYRSFNATSASPSFTKLAVTFAGSIAPDTSGNRSVSDIVLDPGDPNRLNAWVLGQVGGGDGGMYLSTDALATTPAFTHILTTTTANARAEMAITRIGSVTTIYAATGESNGRLRRSSDGGTSWSAFLAGGQNFCSPNCFYSIAIDVNPADASILNLGGSSALVQGRSIDGGVMFTTNAQTAGGLHRDTHVIAIARSNPNIVYFGSSGGIYRSTDAGVNWTSLNNASFNATQFQEIDMHPSDREFLLGGTQDNGTAFRQASGAWTRADFGDGGYALIDQSAANTDSVVMYHTYFNQNNAKGFARVTSSASATDNGWTGFGCGFSGFTANGITCGAGDTTLFYAPMARGPGNPNTIYFGSDRVWRSANLGVTMPAVSQVLVSGQPVTTIAVSPANDNVRIAGTRNGRVFFSNTGGATTMVDITNPAMPPPNPADANQRRAVSRALFHPTDPETAWVAFGGYGVPAGQHVWKSTALSSGAISWVASGQGIPDVPVNGLAVDPASPAFVVAATDIGMFASTNGGANWFPYSEGLPRLAVFDVDIRSNATRLIRIATHGRGIWERTPPPVPPLFVNGFE